METYVPSKPLKIPNGGTKSVNRRRTDNTMTKRKRTNSDVQNTVQKINDRLARTALKTGEGDQLKCFGRVSRCVTTKTIILRRWTSAWCRQHYRLKEYSNITNGVVSL